jgi:type II secretory pathway component PulJ
MKQENVEPRSAHVEPLSGYLLLEVLLGLAVFSLIAVMIFQIIHTTLKATAAVNYLQTQQEKADGICELLRRNIVAMPISSRFETRKKGDSMELIFRNAPFNFSWNNDGAKFGTVVLATKRQASGLFALNVLQDSRDASESYVDSGKQKNADWIPLVDDFEKINWRFFTGREGKWNLEWNDSGTKPDLIELTFKLAGRNHDDRVLFRWPIAQNRN